MTTNKEILKAISDTINYLHTNNLVPRRKTAKQILEQIEATEKFNLQPFTFENWYFENICFIDHTPLALLFADSRHHLIYVYDYFSSDIKVYDFNGCGVSDNIKLDTDKKLFIINDRS